MNTRASLPIAVDAMGGDNAPAEIIRGSLRAALEYGCEIALVGKRDVLEAEIAAIEGAESAARAHLQVVDASQVIEMGEHPANAVRSKKDSSVVRACALVAKGEASACVSAGNSGATLAAALFALKRIEGVARPAIGGIFPTLKGEVFVLDVGANTDCKPEWLMQFGVMGSIYVNSLWGIDQPRVGLLSNGEEPGKGSQLIQETFPLLQSAAINFTGNVEAKELFAGKVDVAVCDGFVGNLVLKTAEGIGEFLFSTLRQEATSTLTGKLGGALLKPRLRAVRDRADWRRTGGALLLGVAGEVVIAHGRSDALAIQNAIRVARQAVQHDVSGIIAGALARPVASVASEDTNVH